MLAKTYFHIKIGATMADREVQDCIAIRKSYADIWNTLDKDLSAILPQCL